MSKTFNPFSRAEAKDFVLKAIDEIYDHDPTGFTLELTASVNEIPTYRISYDGYAKFCTYQREEVAEE